MSERDRLKASRVLMGLGLVALLWAVLFMTSNAIGAPPEELGFANRRSYGEVKAATHEAFIGMVWRALIGAALLWSGSRLAPKSDA